MNQYNNQNQYGMQPQEHELDWESEIVNDAQEFILLEDGDYNFTVMAVERGRFNGSDKMPACNVAKVKLKIENPIGEVTLVHQLMLHSKVDWKLAEFFVSIGLKKKGEPFRMTWNIAGYTGKCRIGKRIYNNNTYNEVKKFYSPEELQTAPQQNQYQQQQPQQAPQQTTYTPGQW